MDTPCLKDHAIHNNKYNRLFSVSRHTKLSAIKDMSRIHTLFISISKKVSGRGCLDQCVNVSCHFDFDTACK